MKYLAIVVLAGASLAFAPAAHAQETSISGTWTFRVENIGLKLVLEQHDSRVTGVLDWPHGDPVKLAGTMTGDTLTVSGDSAGENFTVHMESTGSHQADDSLAGTLKAHFVEFNDAQEVVRTRDQEIPWTAVRGLHDIVHFPR